MSAIVQSVEFASPLRRGGRRPAPAGPPACPMSTALPAGAAVERPRGDGRGQPASVLGSTEVLGEPALGVAARVRSPAIGPLIASCPILAPASAVHGSVSARVPDRSVDLRTGLTPHDDLQTGTAVRPVLAGSVSRSQPWAVTRNSCRMLARSLNAFEQRQREGVAQTGGALTARRQQVGLGSCRAASRSSFPSATRSAGSSRPRTPSGAPLRPARRIR